MDILATLCINLRDEEGFRSHVYSDSTGHATIGYGFNLDQPGADRILAGAGLEPSFVRAGRQSISRDQAEAILERGAHAALIGAYSLIGLDHPDTVVLVIADMCFNMGVGGVSGFHKMLAAIEARNYKLAADEMLDSRWATQVGSRATKLASLMRNVELVEAPPPDTLKSLPPTKLTEEDFDPPKPKKASKKALTGD